MSNQETKAAADSEYAGPAGSDGKVHDGPYLRVAACRFCGGPTRATSNNGIIGPGYREWNRVCKHCGKAQ